MDRMQPLRLLPLLLCCCAAGQRYKRRTTLPCHQGCRKAMRLGGAKGVRPYYPERKNVCLRAYIHIYIKCAGKGGGVGCPPLPIHVLMPLPVPLSRVLLHTIVLAIVRYVGIIRQRLLTPLILFSHVFRVPCPTCARNVVSRQAR